MLWYSIFKNSELEYLQFCRDNYVSYYIKTPFDKYKTDRILKKEAIQSVKEQEWVTEDKIFDILIDRKQNKIVILLK